MLSASLQQGGAITSSQSRPTAQAAAPQLERRQVHTDRLETPTSKDQTSCLLCRQWFVY